MGIQATWLKPDLTAKRKDDPQRQSYGVVKDNFVELTEIDYSTTLDALLIGEGAETTLTGMQLTGLPGVATAGAWNIIKPPRSRRYIILADNGDAGQKFARDQAARIRALYHKAVIQIATPVRPPEKGKDGYDWNDALMAGRESTVLKKEILKSPKFNGDDKEPEEDKKKEKETQALTLYRLAPSEPQGGLFRTEDGIGYADIVVDDHRQTWRIGSKKFERWLRLRFYEEKNQTPSAEAVKQAVEMIETRAQFDKDIPVRSVFIRVGGLGDRIFIDLCDAKWRVVEITATGWWINDNPPVRFRRTNGMLPLPEPLRGCKLEDLRKFVNVRAAGKKEPAQTDPDFVLAVAWLLAAFRERGPYPILKIWGEPGAAKSTVTQVLRMLIDPHKVTRRRLPREDRDLFIAANNAWVISYDNVSQIQEWLSNSLCTIATGGGFATRALHTDQDEVLFDATRPVIINGVENFITKHDLADRMILLELPFITAKGRRIEEDFWSEFEAQRPGILAALLDVVVHGLKTLPTVEQENWPRMADFAHWITACETALWEPGTFRKAYAANRKKATQSAIDDDQVATALRNYINEDESEWQGTTARLLEILTERVGEKLSKSKEWPLSARALTGHLQKAKGALRRVGIRITRSRTSEGRILTISPNLDEVPAPKKKPRKDRHDRHDRHFDSDNNKLRRDGVHVGRHDSNPDTDMIDMRPSRRNTLKSNKK